MNRVKLICLFSISFLLASCTTLSGPECLNADWHSIGLEDGSKGRKVTHIDKQRKTCAAHGVELDAGQYQSGYAAGLARFCTVDMGMFLGETGQEFKDVCPQELHDDFLRGYEQGHRLFLILENMD